MVALVLSLGITNAFAANDASITIENAVNGEKYNLYKIFDLTFGGDGLTNAEGPEEETVQAGTYSPVSYTYTTSGDGDQFLAALQASTSPFTLTLVSGSTTTYNVVRKTAATDQGIIDFIKENYSKLPADRHVSPADVEADNNTVSWTGLPYGYYYAASSLGSIISIDSTLKDVTIHDKNTTTTTDKTVKEDSTSNYGDKNDVDIGDTVEFKTTVVIGKGQKNVVLHDIMQTDKLAFKYDVTVTGATVGNVDKFTVYYPAHKNAQGEDVASNMPTGDSYTNNTFAVAFDTAWTESLNANTTVTITYTAVLTEGAKIGDNQGAPDAGNDNKTKVTFGDSQSTEWDYTRTYTWKIDILKYMKNANSETKIPLAGAEFYFYSKDLKKVAKWESAQGGLFKGWDDSVKDADGNETKGTKLVTLQAGTLELKGLDADEYRLVEVKAPEGYNMLKEPVVVVIDSNTDTDQGTDGNHQADGSAEIKQDNVKVDQVTVLNQSGTQLPSTGGIGTTIFYVVGGVLVLAAIILLVTEKRMSE